LALKAYRSYVKEYGIKACLDESGEYTPEKLYFYGFAQVWCEKSSPASLESQVLTDPHSPADARVLGATSNSLEFKKAFCGHEGDDLAVDEANSCKVW